MLNNLRAIDAQLATIESEQAQALPHNNDENELADDSPHGLSDIWLRLSRHFTPESALHQAVSQTLLTRPPLVSETASCFLLPFDLHVLGLPRV